MVNMMRIIFSSKDFKDQKYNNKYRMKAAENLSSTYLIFTIHELDRRSIQQCQTLIYCRYFRFLVIMPLSVVNLSCDLELREAPWSLTRLHHPDLELRVRDTQVILTSDWPMNAIP